VKAIPGAREESNHLLTDAEIREVVAAHAR